MCETFFSIINGRGISGFALKSRLAGVDLAQCYGVYIGKQNEHLSSRRVEHKKKKNSPVASIKKRTNDYSGSYREHNGINDRAIFILTESNLSIFFPDNLIDVMINDTASQFAFFHIESNKPNNRHQTAAKFYIHTGDDLAL